MKVLFYLNSSKVTTLSFLILLLLFPVTSYSQTGWFSQPLPVNGQVQDLKFFDANTGLISLYNQNNIIRTTNGGYNWNIVLITPVAWEFDIIDSNTIYARGAGVSNNGTLLRSYNKGATWDSLPVSNAVTANGISFVNKDTGWVGGSVEGEPFLWRTTNAGVNWAVNSTVTGRGKVFFLKYKVNGEYIGWSQDPPNMYKTTNSGNSWFQIMNIAAASQIYFVNENTGWAATGDNVRKTTNGGLNWIQHFLPTGFNLIGRSLSKIKILNNDTIYGDYGVRFFGNGKFRGVIWVSTNGGVNWNFQQPDTSFGQIQYSGIDFVNKDTGWSSWIRTNDGGGPLIITGINNQITTKPEIFILEQNYPNPFNSSTRINFSVSRPSYITLTVYDISGKEVLKIYNNEFFTAGNYFTGIDIRRMGLSSGVYIYRMTTADLQSNNIYTESKKLVYLK